MFRAGRLSKLEEIREGALSVIVNKMQAHVRGCLVAVTFKAKAAEKKGIASIQNNVRNYYKCKNWAWWVTVFIQILSIIYLAKDQQIAVQ